MPAAPFNAFLPLPYPCYWLGDDGDFILNEAAQKAESSLYNPETIRSMLALSLRASLGREQPSFGQLLTAGLRLNGIMTLPFPGGLVGVAQNGENAPIFAFTEQMRDTLTDIFAVMPLLAKNMDEPELLYLEHLQQSCYDLLRQASNLEICGRLENGPWAPACFDLAALVVSTFRAAAEILPKKDAIPVHIVGAEGPANVAGDVRVMESALFNLLRNCIQFTRDGNEISVTLKTVDSRVQLTVADRGLGIRPEAQPHIYTPYVSLDPYGDSNDRPGLGLGLSILSAMAERMGGSLITESRFGEGTSITLSLPLAAGESPPLASAPADYWSDRYSPLYVHLNRFGRLPRL